MYSGEPIVLRAAACGLRDLPIQVIMTTGTHRHLDETQLGCKADNILIKPWIPYSELLPMTDVVVTHGGGGTVIACLAAGLPMVVVPLMWDQPENARRVVLARAGISLSPKQCSPKRLRDAVEHILATPTYRENAQLLATRLHGYGGALRAAELLEGIVPM